MGTETLYRLDRQGVNFTWREMRYLPSALLIVVAIIHLLPLAGALGSEQLNALYGIAFDDPNLVILMRHRAVLFGMLGGGLLYAAFRPAAQRAAFAAGFVSVISFLVLAMSVGGFNAQIGRVFSADIVALLCLVVGAGVREYALRRA